MIAALAGLGACRAAGDATFGDCVADEGPRLLVTTTDFSTGALTVVDVDGRCARPDVALASTDAVPVSHGEQVFVLNRFMADYVDVLEPAADWALVHQQPIAAAGANSANPHAIALGPDGLAYVALYGAPELQIYDLDAGEKVGAIDLSSFADDDGIPEASLAFVHDQELFVLLERLDRTDGWKRAADDLLVVIDLTSDQIVDLDPMEDGPQGLELLGEWPKQWRAVPDAPGEILLLGSGVQRIDLELRTTAWVLDEAALAAAGIETPDLPQSFDVSDDGSLFMAAYAPGYAEVQLHRAQMDGSSEVELIVSGLLSAERTLEVVGDELWFGDATPGASGMRAFSTEGVPLLDAPLHTGLAPYSVAEL